MSWLVLGFCVLLAAALAGKALLKADPKTIAQAIRLGGGVVLGAVGLLLTLRGLFVVGGPVGLFGLMLLARGLGWQGMPGLGIPGLGSGSASGQGASDVRTRFLDMTLDHSTGEMDGLVREGPFEGRRLSELGFGELDDLLRTCRMEDDDSARLVEAYMARAHPGEAGGGEEARSSGGERREAGARRAGAMPVHEALEILELPDDASDDDVREAYRRLMKKYHPDQGGSAWYAAKLNEAKDALLER
ncbi:MAG: hypothetical protein TEF_16295 [Rhizobiales bacterium NRL2]|nr:MAG: hypothetical protein TEF_16295 [Rhizobiales bacterium NRL2]